MEDRVKSGLKWTASSLALAAALMLAGCGEDGNGAGDFAGGERFERVAHGCVLKAVLAAR